MSKLRDIVSPYSFRARTQYYLLMTILAACILSLGGTYAYSSYVVRRDIVDAEYTAALSLLNMEQTTDLSTDAIIALADSDKLRIHVLDPEHESLSANELNQLESRTILAIIGGYNSVPITFVKMQNEIISIQSTNQASIMMNNFNRAAFAGILFSAIFAFLSVLSSWRIARPISQLTDATQHISKGDFSIQLPENDDEMGNLMRSFNQMTEALEKTSTQQKDFISSVSHEFRTPIASIKGYARLLQSNQLDSETKKEYITMIAQEADRLSRLSETLLRLSALQQQKDPAAISVFRMDEEVRQVILSLEPIWSERDISFDLQLEPVTIESDMTLLNQVWINLIQNSMKFSSDGSTIHIRTYQNKDACFEIIDHGVGMTEETIKHIFDRFYQQDRSRSQSGVGLGMSLVRRILNILDGDIEIHSKKDEGTQIKVTIHTYKSDQPHSHVS